MKYSRRTALRSLGSMGFAMPLAGCDAPRRGRPDRRIELMSMDSSSDMPIQPAVAVVRETATRAHPPRLRTSLANESDHVVTVGEGRAVHFEYVIDTGGTFILLPAGPDRSYPARSDCWRLTEAIAVTEEYRTFPIEPGTTSLRHVDLYAIPDSEGCLAVGEYRFQTTISIIDDGERSMSTEWGFSVAVE